MLTGSGGASHVLELLRTLQYTEQRDKRGQKCAGLFADEGQPDNFLQAEPIRERRPGAFGRSRMDEICGQTPFVSDRV